MCVDIFSRLQVPLIDAVSCAPLSEQTWEVLRGNQSGAASRYPLQRKGNEAGHDAAQRDPPSCVAGTQQSLEREAGLGGKYEG